MRHRQGSITGFFRLPFCVKTKVETHARLGAADAVTDGQPTLICYVFSSDLKAGGQPDNQFNIEYSYASFPVVVE